MNNFIISSSITIPEHELEFFTSRSGGAGGQHVNKTDSKVTIHWNVVTSTVLNDEQRALLLKNLASRLTQEGELIVSNSESRSQFQNKEQALAQLAYLIKKALFAPKKRMKTKISKAVKEKRLDLKSRHSAAKKLRKVSFDD